MRVLNTMSLKSLLPVGIKMQAVPTIETVQIWGSCSVICSKDWQARGKFGTFGDAALDMSITSYANTPARLPLPSQDGPNVYLAFCKLLPVVIQRIIGRYQRI